MVKYIVILFFTLSCFSISAQTEKFKKYYESYESAFSRANYKDALKYIDICLKDLEFNQICDTLYSKTLFDKVYTLEYLERYQEALKIAEVALSIEKNILGEKHIYVANSYEFFARLHLSINEKDTLGVFFMTKAIKLKKELLGDCHPEISTSLNNLAQLYADMGQYEKALPLQQQALKVYEKTLGDEHPGVALSLNNLAILYSEMGQHEKALSLQEQALSMYKKALGDEHQDIAMSLNNLAALYSEMGQYEKAIPLQEQALEVYKKTLGDEHPDVAMSLSNLTTLYSKMGQYEKALPLLEQALKVYENTLGDEHPDFAIILNNLSSLYSKMGQYEKAFPLQEQAFSINKKKLGDKHPEVATSLNNLAQLYSEMGQYEKALPLQEQALKVYKKALGDEHPDVAMSLNNLASLYSKMGQYEKAFPLQEQALSVSRKALGDEHPNVAKSLNNLASLYSKMGQYDKVIPLQEQALSVSRKSLGDEHPDVAMSLSNLAQLYSDMGQYEKALSLQQQALKVYKKALGDEHPDIAMSLNNLASLYSEMGQYEKALPLQEQALTMYKKALGVEHPDVAMSFNNLAQFYSEMGQYDKALPLQKQAMSVYRKALGDEHPDVASSLSNLASLYSEMGQNEKALPLQEQALSVYKKALGDEHPDVAMSLNNLALLYSEMCKYENAISLIEQALNITNKQLIQNVPGLIEEDKIIFIEGNIYYYQIYDALILNKKNNFKSSSFSCNNNLYLYNLALRSNEVMRKSIFNSNDTVLISDFENWLGLKRQYANGQSLSLDELKYNSIDLKALEDAIEINERSLSLRSQFFQTEQQKLELNYEGLKSNLKAEEVTVMFHSFNYYNGKEWTDSTLYTAYIIRKDQKQPEIVYLFEQAALDTLLSAPDTRSMMNNLYQTGDSALYNLMWKPLEPYLKGVKMAYLVPSGLLHKIAFAAVPLADGTTLSDKYQLHQVLSGHDVVFKEDPAAFNTIDTTSVALFGGINYEFMPEVKDSVYFNPLSLLTESTDRGTAFGYLPGTESEVSSIEQLLKNDKVNVTLLKGNNATEEQFKAMQGNKAPKVLHIATHGFFAPDPKRDLNKENRMRLMGQENRYTAADNPLYRSGLLLAGGNSSWTKKTILPADQDGVLTAYEVANMDLSNTQLVVLSACETALGDVKGREGVFGLQRGFRLAGAKYMLISLWRIPDKETAEYMTKFYSELAKCNNIVTAYQTTQTHMKTTYPYEPQKWAGMVLVE